MGNLCSCVQSGQTKHGEAAGADSGTPCEARQPANQIGPIPEVTVEAPTPAPNGSIITPQLSVTEAENEAGKSTSSASPPAGGGAAEPEMIQCSVKQDVESTPPQPEVDTTEEDEAMAAAKREEELRREREEAELKKRNEQMEYLKLRQKQLFAEPPEDFELTILPVPSEASTPAELLGGLPDPPVEPCNKTLDERAVEIGKYEFPNFRALMYHLCYAARPHPTLEHQEQKEHEEQQEQSEENHDAENLPPTDAQKVGAIFSWLVTKLLRNITFEGATEEQLANRDSPESILLAMAQKGANYAQAFQIMCLHAGLNAKLIRGFAKGIDYKPGMQLTRSLIEAQHAWNAVLIDGQWQLFDCQWAARRLMRRNVTSVYLEHAEPPDENTQKQQEEQQEQQERPTSFMINSQTESQLEFRRELKKNIDFFYYMADPDQLKYMHHPFELDWQLTKSPLTKEAFQNATLVKPAFFRFNLELLSHPGAVVHAKDTLILKIRYPAELINKICFTYSLTVDGLGEIYEVSSLNRFAIQETKTEPPLSLFSIRFPKSGAYKLLVYARHIDENTFGGVCEYKIMTEVSDTAIGVMDVSKLLNKQPYPPTQQSSYGPTERALQYNIACSHSGASIIKSPDGLVDLTFFLTEQSKCVEPPPRLPQFTARLKSCLVEDASILNERILQRSIDHGQPDEQVKIKIYLPSMGEYALEIFATNPNPPANAASSTTAEFFLVWQFLIISRSKCEPPPGLSFFNDGSAFGPTNVFRELQLKTVSHPDPIVRLDHSRRVTSASQAAATTRHSGEAGHAGEDGEADDWGAEDVVLVDTMSLDRVRAKYIAAQADLIISLALPCATPQEKVRIVAQLVDVSSGSAVGGGGGGGVGGPVDEEQECTNYLLQQMALDSSAVHFHLRFPVSGAFYKLHVYAARGMEESETVPMAFTYLIDVPHRLSASDCEYFGAHTGIYPLQMAQWKENCWLFAPLAYNLRSWMLDNAAGKTQQKQENQQEKQEEEDEENVTQHETVEFDLQVPRAVRVVLVWNDKLEELHLKKSEGGKGGEGEEGEAANSSCRWQGVLDWRKVAALPSNTKLSVCASYLKSSTNLITLLEYELS